MIGIDTNILVYAHREDSPFHEAAFERMAALAEGPVSWAIPWPCVHEFLAIVTHPRILAPPTPLSRALAQVDAWLKSPTIVLLAESAAHWSVLRELAAGGFGQLDEGSAGQPVAAVDLDGDMVFRGRRHNFSLDLKRRVRWVRQIARECGRGI